MKMPNKVYDVLKWLAIVALDALGIFYKTIATIWAWPFGNEVLATCAAVSLLIGTLIGISAVNYHKSGGDE